MRQNSIWMGCMVKNKDFFSSFEGRKSSEVFIITKEQGLAIFWVQIFKSLLKELRIKGITSMSFGMALLSLHIIATKLQ